MRKEFVYRKKLEEYNEYYRALCDKRALLFSSVGNEEPFASKEYAENFLLALKIFKKKVPRRVIKERYDDFRDARDLALVVLK
jgi:hypothetical protein